MSGFLLFLTGVLQEIINYLKEENKRYFEVVYKGHSEYDYKGYSHASGIAFWVYKNEVTGEIKIGEHLFSHCSCNDTDAEVGDKMGPDESPNDVYGTDMPDPLVSFNEDPYLAKDAWNVLPSGLMNQVYKNDTVYETWTTYQVLDRVRNNVGKHGLPACEGDFDFKTVTDTNDALKEYLFNKRVVVFQDRLFELDDDATIVRWFLLMLGIKSGVVSIREVLEVL